MAIISHGRQYDRDVESAVAASLLRWGGDTRAARAYRALWMSAPASPPGLRQLSLALEPQPDRRAVAERAAAALATQALARATAAGITPMAFGDAAYPARLVPLVDPPIVLWGLGDPAVLAAPAVALVGSRRATPGGLAMARRLAGDLAKNGLVIISGLARGIDAAAHEGALDAGGLTVAVLGCGVDVVYPRQHEALVRRIGQAGCLVSELPPGTPPLPRHFPLRNRIISGLSLAVVVVEAAERSGSLITARMALEQGRDVLAVPGPVVSGCHRGCHALIKDGAGLVEHADDVLAALGRPGTPVTAARDGRSGLPAHMPPGEPLSVDVLAERAGLASHAALAELGLLELDGTVARTTGGLFVRLD